MWRFAEGSSSKCGRTTTTETATPSSCQSAWPRTESWDDFVSVSQNLFRTIFSENPIQQHPRNVIRNTHCTMQEIAVDLAAKVDIFIHHKGQFLSPNSRSRVDVDVGRYSKLALNHEIVELIGEGERGGNACSNFISYPYKSWRRGLCTQVKMVFLYFQSRLRLFHESERLRCMHL